jgi:hypothetical protein
MLIVVIRICLEDEYSNKEHSSKTKVDAGITKDSSDEIEGLLKREEGKRAVGAWILMFMFRPEGPPCSFDGRAC